jgi:hypothetical protein
MKLKRYINRTWSDDFKQINITPTLYFTKSKLTSCEYEVNYIISINFLIWDVGVIITKLVK